MRQSGVRTLDSGEPAPAGPVTLQGEVLDPWGDPPSMRQPVENARRESITIVRPPELPGLEMQRITNSARKWTIYHSSFDFCSSTRVSGEIDWRYRHQTSGMNPDVLGVLVPGEMHRVTRVDGDADYLLMLVEPSAMARFLDDENCRLLYSARHHLEGLRLGAKLSELWGAVTDRVRDTLRIEGLMSEFLLSISQQSGAPNIAPKSRSESILMVRDFLHDNYQRNVTLEECAKLTGTSKFHLHRSFVADLGIPPHQYLSAIRISRARDLLRSGSRPAEVAGLTGFCDQSHLTRVFAEIVGVTPGTYAAHCATL